LLKIEGKVSIVALAREEIGLTDGLIGEGEYRRADAGRLTQKSHEEAAEDAKDAGAY